MTKYVECRIIDVAEPPQPRSTSIMPRPALATITRRPKPNPRRKTSIGKHQFHADMTDWKGMLLDCLA